MLTYADDVCYADSAYLRSQMPSASTGPVCPMSVRRHRRAPPPDALIALHMRIMQSAPALATASHTYSKATLLTESVVN